MKNYKEFLKNLVKPLNSLFLQNEKSYYDFSKSYTHTRELPVTQPPTKRAYSATYKDESYAKDEFFNSIDKVDENVVKKGRDLISQYEKEAVDSIVYSSIFLNELTKDTRKKSFSFISSIYHVTTPKKAKLYRKTGYIKKPVRGFDTLEAAMAWAIKTKRSVIYKVMPKSNPLLLPDHHNKLGKAYWINEDVKNFKCVLSGDKFKEV